MQSENVKLVPSVRVYFKFTYIDGPVNMCVCVYRTCNLNAFILKLTDADVDLERNRLNTMTKEFKGEYNLTNMCIDFSLKG